MGKKFTKIVVLVLIIALVLPFVPVYQASSADINPFEFSARSVSSGEIMKNEVLNQVEHLKSYFYHVKTSPVSGLKDPKHVTGSPVVDFRAYENNGGAWSSGVYVVKLATANLSPELTFKSGNGGNWNIKFKNTNYYYEGELDPEAELVIGCNFSNKNGYLKIGNYRTGGKGKKELSVKIKDLNEQTIEIGGNKKTKVNGVYGFIRDNSRPYIKSVDVTQEGSNLVVTAKASEFIYSFGDTKQEEWDRTYVDVTLQNTRTGTGTAVLRAYIKDVDDEKLYFETPLGDWAGKDYTVIKLTPSKLRTIEGKAPYAQRELIYDYEWEYYNSIRIARPGCSHFRTLSVPTTSTFLCDVATNSLDLGNILRTMNKQFDNTTPKVDGVSIRVPGKIMNTSASSDKNEWPADIKLSDLYVNAGAKVYFNLTVDETLYRWDNLRLLINVKDKDGKQVKLGLNKVSTIQTVYGIPCSVLEFEPMVVEEGYSMMNGHEGKVIRPVGLSYSKAEDKAGHSLDVSSMGAPAEQLYLDTAPPVLGLSKLDFPQNSPYASLKIDVVDEGAGLNGAPVLVTLKGKSPEGFSFRYVLSDSMNAPTDAAAYTEQAQLSGDSTVQMSFKAHAQSTYSRYLHLMMEPGVAQNVENITATLSAKDVLGNETETKELSIDFEYDNVKPMVSVNSFTSKYYTDTNPRVEITAGFEGIDRREIVVSEYLWLVDDDSVPTDESEWLNDYCSGDWDSTTNYYKESGTVDLTINDSADHTVYFWVRMQDDFGNWSEPVCRSIDVYLSKPSTVVDVLTDVNVPNHAPKVTVTAPDARESDGTTAYTRIALTMGETTYYRVIKTGESFNVFDFEGDWYSADVVNGAFANVVQITDFTPLKLYYGEVKLGFENAYVDLSVGEGVSVDPEDVSYVADRQTVKLRYSGVQDENTTVHKVTFKNLWDPNGDLYSRTDGEALLVISELTGSKLSFEISNELIPDWGVANVDLDRSYVIVEKIDGEYNFIEECVRFTGISASVNQSITVPAVKDNGAPFESGPYRFRVGIYQKGSDHVEEYIPDGFIMVLDAANESLAELWGYSINTFDNLAPVINVEAQNTEFIDSFGISVNRFEQSYRDREFAHYIGGASGFDISVGALSTAKTYYGIEIDTIEGIRFWNAEVNPSEEDLEAFDFAKPEFKQEIDGQEGEFCIRSFTVKEILETIPRGAGGLRLDDLPLHRGMNTIYAQVINSSGILSDINQFYIYVTDTVPTLEISVDSYVPSLRKSETEGQTNVASITYRIDEVFSQNGNVSLEVVQRNPINGRLPVYVNGVPYSDINDYNETVVPIQEGDLVTVSMDSYSNDLDNATLLFVARDDYGGLSIVTPEIGEIYREGNSNNNGTENAVEFSLYENDPWGTYENWTGVYYNEPVEEYNYSLEAGYFAGEKVEGKFVSYIYSNENVIEKIIQVSNEDLYVNKYNIESNEISLGTYDRSWGMYNDDIMPWGTYDTYVNGKNLDLLVWEEASIEISGDGIDGTVVLPYGASAPNKAGLMKFTYSEHEGVELIFADPISETEYSSNHRLYRSYTIKVKDIAGNDHEFTVNYTNSYFHSSNGGASLVSYQEEPDHGVELYLKVFLEDGGNKVITKKFKDGLYEGVITDAYGIQWPIAYEITGTYYDIALDFSTLEPTMNPVTVIARADSPLSISEYDETVVTVENNGTNELTVTAKANAYVYIDSHSKWIDITNIFTPSYNLLWDVPDEVIESGGEYAGNVSVTLISDETDEYGEFAGLEYELIDRYTEDSPSFTFYPGEAASYTFKAEDLAYVCGDEIMVLTEDITVELPLTLTETAPFIPGLNEEDYVPVDEESPDVQLLAYTQQNGLYIDTGKMLRVTNGDFTQLEDHYGYTVYGSNPPQASTVEFVASLGWGSAYRFSLEAFDISPYKIIIKEGVFAEPPAYNSESDVLEGVTLAGRQLTVTKACSFTLFVVDENGFATAIPLDLNNIGAAPVPETVKVPTDGAVRIYVIEPECAEGQSVDGFSFDAAGFEQLLDNDPESEYFGQTYFTVTENGRYNINYSYMYSFDADKAPADVDGVISERVIEIRNDRIYLVGAVKWSENAVALATNKTVFARMQFSQPVSAVRVPEQFVDSVDVKINGSLVSVRYDENCDAMQLSAEALGGTYTTVDLMAVTNIDKEAPVVSLKEKVISEDGKTVNVTLFSTEDVLFATYGDYGTEVEGGYEYSFVARENGIESCSFTDPAGNCFTLEVLIQEIVDSELEVEYSEDRINAVSDPAEIDLSIGDKIYVRANRESKIDLNGGEKLTANANEWVEFTIDEWLSGLWPIIRTVDNYGNVVLGQLSQVKLSDIKAPVVELVQNVLYVKVGISETEVETLLRENINASDLDPVLSYSFDYELDLNNAGSCQVIYSVSDSSGNTATVNGVLRVVAESEPTVKVNGEQVCRDTIYVSDGEALMLTVETSGEPYSVVSKSGLKSVGQMKTGVTELAVNENSAAEILLPFEETGYYTVCIVTQGRNYYRFQIYVEQK